MENVLEVLVVIAAWEFGKWIYRAGKQWWIDTWSV